MALTAWIISVSKGSGSGLMFRSSNSKRTAILVISISSSKQTKFISDKTGLWPPQVDFAFGINVNLPSRRGCKTASDRRPTTVSRPLTSADTAYMVVSLYSKKMHRTCSVNTYSTCQIEGNKTHTVEVYCDKDYRPWCLAVTDSSMFFQREENFIFTPVLSSRLRIEKIHVNITANKTTSLFSGLYFLLLTEKASFSTKCAIPLGYFASCLDPEFTKTRRRGKNKEFLLTSSRCWGH